MRKAIATKQRAEMVEVPLDGGGSVSVDGASATIRDPQGRIVVVYAHGRAEIVAPDGDLVFSAPSGKVRITAGTDIEIEATGNLTQRAGETASVLATRIVQTASHIAQQAERVEVTAARLVERTRDVYREATDLMETRAGRARSLVTDVYSLLSRRTTMASKEDTTIDGKRVLLG
jgi:hypothetical protein